VGVEFSARQERPVVHAVRIAHSLKICGSCLILLALFASGARAVTIEIDPGAVGNLVNSPLNFVVPPPGAVVVDLVFSDQKTLTWGPGPLFFALTASPGGALVPLNGYLSDGGGEIAGTAFDGLIDGGIIELSLAAEVVWTGMHFESAFQGAQDEVLYSLIWTSKPSVGVIPEPGTAALLGLGIVVLGVRRRADRPFLAKSS
jgi:hypothetical protein